MAAKPKIATIRGTFVAPGRSLNGNLYTRENIAKAVTRMQGQIADGSGAPAVTMLTSHNDDSILNTVGQVTGVGQRDDGSGWFEAMVPDTTAGRDLATLAANGYVRSVSLAGQFLGDVRTVQTENGEATTSDDLAVYRIDYVPFGGVERARLDDVTLEIAPSLPGSFRDLFEGEPEVTTVDDWVEMTAAEASATAGGSKKPYGNVAYADPGYRDDKRKRYPIDTKDHAKAAWSYINQEKNASKYSSADLAKIKARIRGALRKFGVDVSTAKSAAPQLSLLETTTSGGTSEAVPQPDAMAREHSAAPYMGAVRMDPDADGDIDGWVCPTCGGLTPNHDPTTNPDDTTDQLDLGDSAPRPTTQEAAPVTDTPAANAATTKESTLSLTREELDQIVAEAVAKKLEEASKPKLPETQEELDALIAQRTSEALAKEQRTLPPRKGYVANETAPAAKPWEMTTEEYRAFEIEGANRLFTGRYADVEA